MSDVILPDCTLCDGPVVLDFVGATPVEVCQRCGATNRPIARPVNRREVRELVATVLEVRPELCDACVIKRCTGCLTATCQCPRSYHPRRPVGDLTPEGMALLAAERQGHLEPAELPGGAR